MLVRKILECSLVVYEAYVVDSNITNHYPALLSISYSETEYRPYISKTVHKYDHKKFESLIRIEELSEILTSTDPNIGDDRFYGIFDNIHQQCKTRTTIQIRQHNKIKPWITKGIIESIKTETD